MTTKITANKRRFVEEYLIDLNATQAAIRAGYSPKTASVKGSQLLAEDAVAELVRKKMMARSERTEITQDRVLKELANIGFANMLNYMQPTENGEMRLDLSVLTREEASAISEYNIDYTTSNNDSPDITKVRFKLHDKRQALVDIGKHLGMFKGDTDDEEQAMPVKVVVQVQDARKHEPDIECATSGVSGTSS